LVGSNQQSLRVGHASQLGISATSCASEWLRWQRRQLDSIRETPAVNDSVAGLRSEKMARLEAAFFVAENPLSTRKLCQFALLADTTEVKELIEELNQAYEADGSAFGIERVASGYQMLTRPRFAHWLDQLHQRTAELKLSPPAMETLTIVAYRQPITRADVEAIRGVQCSEILKLLMDRGLVKIGGEDDSLGRPYLYVTTRMFLELFGLRTLDDLPSASELRAKPQTVASSETEDSPEGASTEPEEEHPQDDIDQESAA